VKRRKLLTVFLFMAVSVFSIGLIVYASSLEQDGLYAEITTNKNSYSVNEDIKITIKLENRNDYAVENISIDGIIPKDLTLKSGQANKQVARLEPKQKVELSFTAIKKATVNRKIKVKSIKLNKKKITLKPKQSKKLKATVKPKNATNKKIKWTSSNRKVVKVNSKGKITALKKGKVKIYAKAKDGSGKKAVCTVTVKKAVKKKK